MKKSLLGLLLMLAAVVCLAGYAHAAGGVSVSFEYPSAAGYPYDKFLDVSVRVTSEYEMKTVIAKVKDREAALQKVCQYRDCTWKGVLSVEGLEKGNQTLTVTATDQMNQTGQASIEFVYDSKPEVSVKPADQFVITANSARILVTTVDDRSIPDIKASLVSEGDFKTIWTGTGAGVLDQTVDVSSYAGKSLRLMVDVSDGFYSEGRPVVRVSSTSMLYVESSDRLAVADEAEGRVIDFDESRLLYTGSDMGLYVKNRSTGGITLVRAYQSPISLQEAKLIPGGAILWLNDSSVPEARIYIWTNNVLKDTGIKFRNYCCESYTNYIQISGNYALVPTGRINLATGEVLQNALIDRQSVLAPNGEFVFTGTLNGSSRTNIYRYYADGLIETVVQEPNYDSRTPKWDGNTVVYTRGSTNGIFKKDRGGASQELSSYSSPVSYEVNQGWIAFTKQPAGGAQQIYLQSPDGSVTQATYYFSSNPLVDKLGSDGTFTFTHADKLYIKPAGDTASYFAGSSKGNTKIVNGKWYKTMGNSVLQIKLAGSDAVPPVWPAGAQLTVTDVTYNSARLQWPQAQDNVGVSRYDIYRDGQMIDSVSGSVYSYTAAGLAPQTTYTFSVTARDAAGNASVGNPGKSVTTSANVPPSSAAVAFASASDIAEVGSTFSIQLRASDAKDLYAFLLKLQYDTAQLKLTKIEYSGEFGSENVSAVFGKDTSTAGLVKLTGVQLGAVPGKNGNVGLITLSFIALKNGQTPIALLPDSEFADSRGRRQNVAAASFLLTVGGGDFDHDGKVTLNDLFLISQKNGLKRGQPGFDEQFDLKPDGVIDSKDIQYVAMKAAKG